MPVLPVPMIISLLLLALLAQHAMTRETHRSLLALIGACAVQSAIIALVQYYGVSQLRPLQPLGAMVIPPIAWLAFTRATEGAARPRHVWLHGAGFLSAVLCLVFQPSLLDLLIPLVFTAYGVAMLLRLARGEDSLPHSRLESGALPLLAWRVIALSLIASAACDVLIAYSMVLGGQGAVLWVPSVMSSLTLFSLGALSVSHAMESGRDESEDHHDIPAEDVERDQAIVAKLDDYANTHKPYLDPDLTLTRLSRKLLVPAKQLSTAINRVKGENVSRYINRLRIEDACQRLARGQSVTTAMFDAGFNTKSNFNREFLRINKMSPREWLATRPGTL